MPSATPLPSRFLSNLLVPTLIVAAGWLWPQPVGAQWAPVLDDPAHGQVALLTRPIELPTDPAAPAGRSLLTVDEVERYRRIFAAQDGGDMVGADRDIAALADDRLMGHVLFQRYMHPTAWRSSFAELRDWMAAYGDHPGAERLYDLAVQRRPGGAARPATPRLPDRVWGSVERYGVPRCALDRGPQVEASLQGRIRAMIADDRVTAALETLEAAADRLDIVTYDRLRGRIAAAYYYLGLSEAARETAVPAAERSGRQAPRAAWTAGLTAWRVSDYPAAETAFALVAEAPCASAWWRAGAAYWAHRAALRDRRPTDATAWLQRAALHPRTFYGQLSLRALGIDPPFAFDAPVLTAAHLETISRIPAGRRALGLLQVGLPVLAEQELEGIDARAGAPDLAEAMLALADAAGLARVASRLGTYVRPSPDGYHDAALYPIPYWFSQPSDAQIVDRALVLAVVRQESRFDREAVSRAGAAGLMQLMPYTARDLDGGDYRGRNRAALFDLDRNLRLGQTYLLDMMALSWVRDDLVRTLISYNAGPGNLQDWLVLQSSATDDPLLFLESIPIAETRNYLERVLANLWIYRTRFGQPTPSLDALAVGDRPLYERLDPAAAQVATLP